MDDRPELRIGSSERERAQSALIEHFSAGRLDVQEFEERSGLTAAARTAGELAAVFTDLPGGLPAALPARPLPRPRGSALRNRVPIGALRAAVGPVVVVLLLVGLLTGHGWLLFLVLPMSGAARSKAWVRGPHRLDGPGFHQR